MDKLDWEIRREFCEDIDELLINLIEIVSKSTEQEFFEDIVDRDYLEHRLDVIYREEGCKLYDKILDYVEYIESMGRYEKIIEDIEGKYERKKFIYEKRISNLKKDYEKKIRKLESKLAREREMGLPY